MNKEILEQMRRLAVSILDDIKIAEDHDTDNGMFGALYGLDQDMKALKACYDYLLVANGRRLP